jgi:hypothetical protein
VQFYSDVLTVCKNGNPPALNIQQQWSALDSSFALLNQSFKKEQASLLTGDLIAHDLRRDNAIICLRKLADSYTNHHDAAKQKARNQLLMVIDKYGSGISRMNYHAETSVLEKLVADLQSNANNTAAVKMLGLDDTVTELKAANELFSKTYLDRVGEAASKDLTAAGTLAQECRDNYNTLVKHIEANATINPSEAYTALINKLNNLIEKFNTTVATRGGRNNNGGGVSGEMPS